MQLQHESAGQGGDNEKGSFNNENCSEQSLQVQSQVSWERRQRITSKTSEMAAGLVGAALPEVPVTEDPYAVTEQRKGAGVLW